MKINKEQFDEITTGMAVLQHKANEIRDQFDIRTDKFEAKLAAIEQSQGVLCERLDELALRLQSLAAVVQNGQMQDHANLEEILDKLDAIQGALLHEQFRKGKGGKPCRKSKSKK